MHRISLRWYSGGLRCSGVGLRGFVTIMFLVGWLVRLIPLIELWTSQYTSHKF